ncbi:MAG TPA: hypothetical protein VKB84_19350 [Candidatus Binataceae bacterium]|nr:hypothetical protein [Candidatus Binataceae bacterium]
MTKAILIVIAALMLLLLLRADPSNAEPAVNLRTLLASPVDLTLYSPDRKLVIGHARYTIKEDGKTVEIIGETHYASGERDWERVMMEHQAGNPLPVVTSFQGNFMNRNDSPQLREKAEFKSGQASCTWSNEIDDSHYEDALDFPPDTYVGAASVVPLEYALKKGESSVRFHVFDCTPKPSIFTVDAKLENGIARWSYYPGELAQMGLTPDLGWLNIVARPFIPNITVWFDPGEGYQYVGSAKNRYYRGLAIVLVRDNRRGRTVREEPARRPPPPGVSVDPAKTAN